MEKQESVVSIASVDHYPANIPQRQSDSEEAMSLNLFLFLYITSYHNKYSIRLMQVMKNTGSGIRFTAAFVLYLGFLLIHSSAPAQEYSDSLAKGNSTRAYIEEVDTVISLKFNFNTEYEQFEIKGDNFYYDIRPNISLSNKLSFSYRFISLGIGFTPRFLPGNNDDDYQGNTKSFSLGFNFYSSHWLQEVQLNYLSGFYLHNTEDYPPFPGWTEADPKILFPDLKVARLSGSTGYKLNRNFSIKSISSRTEIQLRSCGSFIPLLNYDYYEIDNESENNVQASSQKSNNLQITASVGYLYTLVTRSKLYASAGIMPGFGMKHTNLITRFFNEEMSTKNLSPLFRIQEKIGIGYNTRKFFTGVDLSLAQSVHYQKNTSIREKRSQVYIQVAIGYRFRTPPIVRNATDGIKDIIPTFLHDLLE